MRSSESVDDAFLGVDGSFVVFVAIVFSFATNSSSRSNSRFSVCLYLSLNGVLLSVFVGLMMNIVFSDYVSHGVSIEDGSGLGTISMNTSSRIVR